MKIHEAAQLTGLTKKAIRYYEQEGLISPSLEPTNGYRVYSQQDVERLHQIALLRELQLGTQEIKRGLDHTSNFVEILEEHKQRLDKKLQQLEGHKHTLSWLLSQKELSLQWSNTWEELRSKQITQQKQEKRKPDYALNQLKLLFPGPFGVLLAAKFAPVLQEPLDSPEKEMAWSRLIDYLDQSPEIKLPELLGHTLNEMENTGEMPVLEELQLELYHTIMNLTDETKEQLKASVANYLERSGLKHQAPQVTRLRNDANMLRQQLQDMGYYQGFVEQLKILSANYRQFHETLVALNDELGLTYDEEGRIVRTF